MFDKRPGGTKAKQYPVVQTTTVSTTKYSPDMNNQVKLLAMLGATRETIAEFFGVTPDTISSWLKERVGFRDSYKEGAIMADAKVAMALYHRALGYEHEDEKIFCSKDGVVTRVPTVARYAPDTGAALAWLKARQPEQWNTPNKQEHTGADGGPMQHDYLQIVIPDNNREAE